MPRKRIHVYGLEQEQDFQPTNFTMKNGILIQPNYKSPVGLMYIKLDGSFVWIATTDGLVYYDGIADVSGKLTETDGLPSEMINTVAIEENSIWIGTLSGLARLDKSFITPHVSRFTLHPMSERFSLMTIPSG